MTEGQAIELVLNELRRARDTHAPMHSHHEAFAVIYEEFIIEYGEEVFKGGRLKRNETLLKIELVHSAAMCMRALIDLCEFEREPERELEIEP